MISFMMSVMSGVWVVWQDFMFACANYRLTEEFESNIKAEFADNIRRLRSHPSLGLWCGKTTKWKCSRPKANTMAAPKLARIIFACLNTSCPRCCESWTRTLFTGLLPPSSGGGFDEPNAPDRGDVHYWEVWHGSLPFAEYRRHFFRYTSEFGFQSFPSMKTIERFTLPEDRNIFSRVMERHQRNEGANGKIMNYLSQTYLYPSTLDILVYASQLLQAEAIRYGVEHWRRHRGRCMGAIYWQLNDIWPVASWASIDYYGPLESTALLCQTFFCTAFCFPL